MVQVAKYLREKGAEIYCPWELKIENAWDYSQEDWARKFLKLMSPQLIPVNQ
jgi:hypothetical protein